MKYRLTCLTPLLVGDGSKLSPIDYMVWKDHVNVLDQRRIFRLLAKGPRLDSYLTQIRKADKLDFASWGGFAQNFAGRRIPFEHPSCAVHWERLRSEHLHIPTFVCGPSGPYLPGSALKGALRTAAVSVRTNEQMFGELAARLESDRPPRRPAEMIEERTLGAAGNDQLKALAVADSSPVSASCLQVYLLRTATLEARGPERFALAWKQSPRGTVEGRRADDSTPAFAEMARPGTVFEGTWSEKAFFTHPEVVRALRWKQPLDQQELLRAANAYASQTLTLHGRYAEWAELPVLARSVQALQTRLKEAAQTDRSCLLPLGWGSGLIGKTAWLGAGQDNGRQLLRQLPMYSKAVRSGLPFPKTRRILFLENQPATLPGWVLLEVF